MMDTNSLWLAGAAWCLALVNTVTAPQSAHADPVPQPDASTTIYGWTASESIVVGGTSHQDGQLSTKNLTAKGNQSIPAAGPSHEVRYVVGCRSDSSGGGSDEMCGAAVKYCANRGEPGPYSRILRREITAAGPGPWKTIGSTCFASPEPGGVDPAKLRAAVEREFALTPLATPTGTTQPPGGATLVNLPTYFHLTFPAATSTGGYSPGHIRDLTILGQPVQLRIAGQYTYDYGDGTTAGPTTSPGGPYPTGDITHTYVSAGTLTPLATTRFSADYRVANGPWQALTGTATRTTTLGPLDVLAVHPVLVANG